MFDYRPPVQPFLCVAYKDAQIIAVSKPSGLLSVPGRGEEKADCMEARVKAVYPEALTVHRLDMETSGLMLYALGKDMQKSLGQLFEHRKIEKDYVAVVDGTLQNDEGIVDLPMRCDWPNRPKQLIDHELGKNAITNWRVLEKQGTTSRVHLKPETGRSHQLRLHMQALGHPILGDALYHSAPSGRLQLHAEQLVFQHPLTNKIVKILDPCPF